MNTEDAPAHFPSQVLGTNTSGMEMLLLTPASHEPRIWAHTHVVSALFNTSIKKNSSTFSFQSWRLKHKCLAMQEELGVLSVCSAPSTATNCMPEKSFNLFDPVLELGKYWFFGSLAKLREKMIWAELKQCLLSPPLDFVLLKHHHYNFRSIYSDPKYSCCALL